MTDTTVEPAAPEPAPASLLDRLGPRAERRMTPRLTIALAGTGALIAIGGAIGLGGDSLVDDDGDIQRIPGVAVALVLLVAGLAVLRAVRTGALATAASTAVAVSVPMLVFFATVNDDDFPFFAFDALLLLCTVAWLAAYVVGPARGRMVFLALALVFAPIFVMEQVESISTVPESIGQGFSQMFGGSSSFDSSSGFDDEITFDEDGNPVFPDDFEDDFSEDDFSGEVSEDELEGPFGDLPDPTTLGVIALVFGLLYVAASHLLTRRGYDGTATPLGVIGAVGLVVGISFLTSDLKELVSGLALVVLGLAVTVVGAAGARRFLTWFGALLVGQGVITLVSKALGDDVSVTTGSIVFLLVGLAVVFLAHLLGVSLGEIAEEDQRRSFRDWPQTRRGPDTSPAPDDVFAP